MAEPKTRPTTASVAKFIAAQKPASRRQECATLVEMMKKATKCEPVLWGGSIVGFDVVPWMGASGKSTHWPAVAFAPRKTTLTFYLMASIGKHPELFEKLGKHKTGKGCLYINKLADVDLSALQRLVALSYADSKKRK